MVRLNPVDAPVELTPEVVDFLTKSFKESDENVWNQKYIQTTLLGMSHNKCGYCECKIDEESKYLEIEHFKPKIHFPDLVVVWSNLLPSCKHCNGQKGEHNTEIDPIVNPTINNPKDHLKLKSYRFYPRDGDSTGKMTIEVLDLNNRRRLVDVRAQIGFKIHEELEKLAEAADEYIALTLGNKKTRRKRTIINGITNLLLECQPTTEYSATAATELIEDENYQKVKGILSDSSLWSNEMEALEAVATVISLQ